MTFDVGECLPRGRMQYFGDVRRDLALRPGQYQVRLDTRAILETSHQLP